MTTHRLTDQDNDTVPPAELRGRPQWVAWRVDQRNGKATKVPYQTAGRLAASTDPATWLEYDAAVALAESDGFAGIGYVFAAGDRYFGVDLDHCRDAMSGAIALWAQAIIDQLDTYTELSPSGTGVHIIGRGRKPGGKCTRKQDDRSAIEIYDQGRYLTVTGQVIQGHGEIRDRQEQLTTLYRSTFGDEPEPVPTVPSEPADATADADLLARIAVSRDARAFHRLYTAGESRPGLSPSEDDFALACILARHTRDDAQLERLLRSSPLAREKWDTRRGTDTYLTATIAQARRKVGAGAETEDDPATPTPRFLFRGVRELLQRPAPQWRLHGLLPTDALAVLYGPSGSGKTFVALDHALSIATGTAWLGRATIAAPVVWVAAEGGSGLGIRMQAWLDAHERTPEEVEGRFHVLEDVVSLLDASAVAAFLSSMATVTAGQPPALVVFDTLAHAIPGGDENSARDVGLAIASANHIRRVTGGLVTLIHHTGKMGELERGSTALRGAADTMLLLRERDGRLVLETTKQRHAAPGEPIALRLVPYGPSVVVGDTGLVLESADLTKSERVALEALNAVALTDGATAGEWLDAVSDQKSQIGRGTFFRARRRLLDLGLIEQAPKGRRYLVTGRGIAALVPKSQ